MLKPEELPSLCRALVRAFARKAKLDPERVLAWVCRLEAPPDEIRRQLVEAFFPEVSPDDFLRTGDEGLTLPRDLATVATTLLQESSRETKVSRAQLDATSRKHPFVRALVKEGLTVTELAKELKVPRSTVQSWYSANNPRPIPRAMVTRLEKRFNVPPSAWASITE